MHKFVIANTLPAILEKKKKLLQQQKKLMLISLPQDTHQPTFAFSHPPLGRYHRQNEVSLLCAVDGSAADSSYSKACQMPLLPL